MCTCSAKWVEYAPLVLRIVVGLTFLMHGWQKIHGDSAVGFFTQIGIPMAGFFGPLVTWLEFLGGIGLILGVINVFIRDISQVVPIVLQVLFWFTPIVYPATIIPPQYLNFLKMNPLFPIIEGYHDILLYGKAPDMLHFIPLIVVGFVILSLGLFMFRKASPEMVDVL